MFYDLIFAKMKKILSLLVVMLGCIGVVQAQVSLSVNKTYTGILTNVVMNGSPKDDVSGQNFKLDVDSDGFGTITGTVSGIETMPGTIYINIGVEVDVATGAITAIDSRAGYLQIIGLTIPFTITSFSGSITDSDLSISVAVVGNYFGISFLSSFDFNGN